ncbi:MAG: hypothetical protein ACE37M_02485 [Henriciella sp.]
MKTAPFSYTIPTMIMLFTSILLGALLGGIFGNMSINQTLGAFLVGFLPLPVISFLRMAVGQLMANAVGHKGEAPQAFSFWGRYLIGAMVASIIAFVAINVSGNTLTIYSGLLIAVLSASIVSVIMALRIALS